MQTSGKDLTLTSDHIHLIRALIHPEIITELPKNQSNPLQKEVFRQSIHTLDYTQEKRLYEIPSGHSIIYGEPGSGKTAILTSRIRYIAAKYPEYQILVLCVSNQMKILLNKILVRYLSIDLFTFGELINHLEIPGIPFNYPEREQEPDYQIYDAILRSKSNISIYDAVFIAEGNDFSPSWFQTAHLFTQGPGSWRSLHYCRQ